MFLKDNFWRFWLECRHCWYRGDTLKLNICLCYMRFKKKSKIIKKKKLKTTESESKVTERGLINPFTEPSLFNRRDLFFILNDSSRNKSVGSTDVWRPQWRKVLFRSYLQVREGLELTLFCFWKVVVSASRTLYDYDLTFFQDFLNIKILTYCIIFKN